MKPKSRLLSGLVLMGRYRYSAAERALGPHKHERAIEICYLVKGRQTYKVNNTLFRLQGGDTFVTFPDESHSSGGMPQEKGELYWVILQLPEKGDSFLGLEDPHWEPLVKNLLNMPYRHFSGSWLMREHLDAFTRTFHEPRTRLKSLSLMHHIHALLLEVIQSGQQPKVDEGKGSLLPILEHIHANPHSLLPVAEMAQMAGISESRFKARFKEETGVPPAEYAMRARIEEATRRLHSGKYSVTEVSHDLGFSSSQYFATVFRRYTGKSPRELLP